MVKKLLITISFLYCIVGCSDNGPKMAGSQSRYEKIHYIRTLADSEDVSYAPKIAAYLDDPDKEVVMAACYYVGSLKGRQYINNLVVLLSSDDDRIVNMAGAGLSQMVDNRDENILPHLYKILDHEFLLARISAIDAIGNIRSESSTKVLMEMFQESSSGQKASIIYALGKIGSSESLPMLEAYLEEVIAMDHSVPDKGGTRGADPHPSYLQRITEEAIKAIKSGGA